MAMLFDIDTVKSMASGRLIEDKNWLDTIERLAFLLLTIFFIIPPLLLLYHLDWNNLNDKAIGLTLLPLLVLFGLYTLYRKISEAELIKIQTSFPQHKNKKDLLVFLQQKGYQITGESNEIVVVTGEEELSCNKRWTKTITFIISDNNIYFNIVKNHPSINPPVFFTHLFLKRDLRKLFSATGLPEVSKAV